MSKGLALIALIYSSICIAEDLLVEKKIFYRCYSQILKKRPSIEHPLLKKIEKQKVDGSEACSELVSSVSIDKRTGLFIPKNSEAQEIAQNFQKIHNSWFPLYDLNVGTQDHPNTDLYDTSEMGYHFTWVLFNETEKLSHVLTKKRSFKSIRSSEKPHLFFIDKDIGGRRLKRKGLEKHQWKIGGSKDENDPGYQGPVHFWNPELVNFGDLIGLTPYQKSKNIMNVWFSEKEKDQLDIHRPLGGGIIGTIPYLLLNAGQNNLVSDGGLVLHRRWSTSVMKDLLCRNIPTLDEDYVLQSIRKKSKHIFRQKKDCMTCHLTIDQMAAVIRNIENYNSGDVDTHYTIRNIYPHQFRMAHHGNLPDSMKNFYKTKPEGRFIHQSLDGKIINTPVKNIEELGRMLASNSDFYKCITKRYFEYFTGISLNLEVENWKKPTAVGRFVNEQARVLAKNQNIKEVLSNIFSSQYFRDGEVKEKIVE